MKLLSKIRAYFRAKKERKIYLKIKDGLLGNPELMCETKAKFEKSFGGEDRTFRTPRQWGNLVRVYGRETVCEREKITDKELTKKCSQSFSSKIKEQLNRIN